MLVFFFSFIRVSFMDSSNVAGSLMWTLHLHVHENLKPHHSFLYSAHDNITLLSFVWVPQAYLIQFTLVRTPSTHIPSRSLMWVIISPWALRPLYRPQKNFTSSPLFWVFFLHSCIIYGLLKRRTLTHVNFASPMSMRTLSHTILFDIAPIVILFFWIFF